MNYIFTSESVSDGHPDNVADQISDALVDAGLKAGDSTTRVAVETLVTTNHVTLAGEVKNFNVSKDEVKEIVRNKVKDIGYEPVVGLGAVGMNTLSIGSLKLA